MIILRFYLSKGSSDNLITLALYHNSRIHCQKPFRADFPLSSPMVGTLLPFPLLDWADRDLTQVRACPMPSIFCGWWILTGGFSAMTDCTINRLSVYAYIFCPSCLFASYTYIYMCKTATKLFCTKVVEDVNKYVGKPRKRMAGVFSRRAVGYMVVRGWCSRSMSEIRYKIKNSSKYNFISEHIWNMLFKDL